jgi:polar amino acid transport system permease protein
METLLAVAVYYVMVVTVFTWLFRALENRLDIQRKRPQTLSEAECEALRQSLKALTTEQKPGRQRRAAGARSAGIENPGASIRC